MFVFFFKYVVDHDFFNVATWAKDSFASINKQNIFLHVDNSLISYVVSLHNFKYGHFVKKKRNVSET